MGSTVIKAANVQLSNQCRIGRLLSQTENYFCPKDLVMSIFFFLQILHKIGLLNSEK